MPRNASLQGSCPVPFTLPSELRDRPGGRGHRSGRGAGTPSQMSLVLNIGPQAGFPTPPLPHGALATWTRGFAALCLCFPTCKLGLWGRVTTGARGGSPRPQPSPLCPVSPPSQARECTPHRPLPWFPSGDGHKMDKTWHGAGG